jgi:Ca-activated chloride channel family protein
MSGDRIEGAKSAICALIDRLDPADNFGVVTFDDRVEIPVAAGPLTDKVAAKQAVATIHERGSTDLSAGYVRGLQEARRVATKSGATVLIVSDGHANAGILDGAVLAKIAGDAASHKVTTSTVGFGLGYDEQLLSAIARGGQGNELFAEEADTGAAVIAGEVDGLLSQVAQACSLRITVRDTVQGIQLLNDLPTVGLDNGIMVELGSFYAGETRRLVLRLAVPKVAALGLAEVATLALTSVSLPDFVQHTATMPITVNVVPGDQAAGRVKDPTVTSEALFQTAQQSKRDASRLMSQGDAGGAADLLRQTSADLGAASMMLPPSIAAELRDEMSVFDALAEEVTYDVSRAAKSASYDASMKNRTRGRQSRGGQLRLVCAEGHPECVRAIEAWEFTHLARIAATVGVTIDLGVFRVISTDGARRVAAALADSPLAEFFGCAAEHGGVKVERA